MADNTVNYQQKLVNYFARLTGGSMKLFVKPTTEEEACTFYKLLSTREAINVFIEKPVDNSKDSATLFYIGLGLHKSKRFDESDSWMKASYEKGCEKALMFLLDKHEDTDQEKWIDLCLIARGKEFDFCDKFFRDNLVRILVTMIHCIEYGATSFLPMFVAICCEEKDLTSLMLLSNLRMSKKVILTKDVKDELSKKFEEASKIFSDPSNVDKEATSSDEYFESSSDEEATSSDEYVESSSDEEIKDIKKSIVSDITDMKEINKNKVNNDVTIETCANPKNISVDVGLQITTKSEGDTESSEESSSLEDTESSEENSEESSEESSSIEDIESSEESDDDGVTVKYFPSTIIETLREKFGLN